MAQYADIVQVVAPSESAAGSRVDITVRIKNLHSSTIGIMVGGALEYRVSPWPGIEFPNSTANVSPGAIHSFSGWFVMPDSDVKIHAYSYYYGSDGYWHFDEEEIKTVRVAEVPASEFGSIEIISYERR